MVVNKALLNFCATSHLFSFFFWIEATFRAEYPGIRDVILKTGLSKETTFLKSYILC